jgi:4-amino-4-deoxychorismate lyase
MGSSSGLLISGTMCNVFLDTGAGLVTPALDLCGIAGILRAVVLREAAAMDIPVQVTDIPLAALDNSRGAFLTNIRLSVLPITRLNGRALEISARVQALAGRVANLED